MYSALFICHGRQECSFYEIQVTSSPTFPKLFILLGTWHLVEDGFHMHKLYIVKSDQGKVRKLKWFPGNNHSSTLSGVSANPQSSVKLAGILVVIQYQDLQNIKAEC